MSFDWSAIIAAGVSLAQDQLAQEDKEDERVQSDKQLLMNLADKERDRIAAEERAKISAEASMYGADKTLEAQKKRILGDVLLRQGEGQEKLGIEAYRAHANKPERFNDAASVLAGVLAR